MRERHSNVSDRPMTRPSQPTRRVVVAGLLSFGMFRAIDADAATNDIPCPLPSQDERPRYKIVTADLTTPEGPVALSDGSVLVCEMLEGRITRVLPEGSISTLCNTGGAPNGAAIGPDGALYVTNNGGFNSERVNGKLQMRVGLPPGYKGGSIQRIDLASGALRTLYTRGAERPLRAPNDLVFDNTGGFYFTDMGKFVDDSSIDLGAVYWARPDGSEIRTLVSGLLTPNGIALSPDQRHLYVALTEKRQVLAFEIDKVGRLVEEGGRPRRRVIASVDGDLAFDSMKLESNGNLVVGTLKLGCLTVMSPIGQILERHFLPDPNVTNLAFGGASDRTAFVTLTATGQLVAVEWPRAGLALAYRA
jgi:gluconolactonase